jgi:intracellular multiplication protein IcmD
MRLLLRGLLLRLMVIGAGLLFVSGAMAAEPSVTLATIQSSMKTSLGSLASILQDVALIAGIGFILAAFFKLHQHKMNPTQVPMSQGITLLLIGAALAVFPDLLGTATKGVFNQGPTQLGGTGINAIIGGGTGSS